MAAGVDIERTIWVTAFIKGLAEGAPKDAEASANDALGRYQRRWEFDPVPEGIHPLAWKAISELCLEIDADIQAQTVARARGDKTNT